MDVYGSGEDMDAIKAKADAHQLAITFSPGRDHLDDQLHAYRQKGLCSCSACLPDRRVYSFTRPACLPQLHRKTCSSSGELPLRVHRSERLLFSRVFVNPSTSDVVATTSAEALAMGKWVVCPEHPSNSFFRKNFANCLIYRCWSCLCICRPGQHS